MSDFEWEETRYKKFAEGYRFKEAFVTTKFVASTKVTCAEKCLAMGEKCNSFTIENDKDCELSFLRVPANATASQMFEKKVGVKLYCKKEDQRPDAVDVHTLSTNDTAYILVTSPGKNWDAAFNSCRLFGDGVYMAAIRSEAEQNTIREWLKSNAVLPGHVWLAGRFLGRDNDERCWVWAVPGLPAVNYTAWEEGHPTKDKDKNCMTMPEGYEYKWMDDSCHYLDPYLCARPVEPNTGEQVTLDDVSNLSCNSTGTHSHDDL